VHVIVIPILTKIQATVFWIFTAELVQTYTGQKKSAEWCQSVTQCIN